MKFLIIGGAGYIGRNLAHCLLQQGDEPIIVDNFQNSDRRWISPKIPIFSFDAGLQDPLTKLLQRQPIDVVIDLAFVQNPLAAAIYPLAYYHANFISFFYRTKVFLDLGIKRILVLSGLDSFAKNSGLPVSEETVPQPTTSLGHIQQLLPGFLSDLALAEGLSYLVLRLGNVGGCTNDGIFSGENLNFTSNFLGLATRALLGEPIHVPFYQTALTADHSIVRDYLHIADVVEALLLVLPSFARKTTAGGKIYHLAPEKPTSQRQLVTWLEEVSGRKLAWQAEELPQFLPAVLHSNFDEFFRDFSWRPKRTAEKIVDSSWIWAKKHFSRSANPLS